MRLIDHAERLTPAERSAAVLAAKAGDVEARDRLFADTYALIGRFVKATDICRKHQRCDVEDIMQELAASLPASLRRLDLGRADDPGRRFTTVVWFGFQSAYSHYVRRRSERALPQSVDYEIDSLPAEPECEPHKWPVDGETVLTLIGRLPEREAVIVRERYGIGCEPKTLLELAGRLGVTRERVRQLQMAGLSRLHRLCLAATPPEPEPETPPARRTPAHLSLSLARRLGEAKLRLARAKKVATQRRIAAEIRDLTRRLKQARKMDRMPARRTA